MKTRCMIGFCRTQRLLAGLLLALLSALAPAAFGANSFVVGLSGLQIVDTTVDSLGVTYVLASDGGGNCIINKYGTSGVLIPWTGDGATNRIISGFTPRAFCLAAGTTNLYIAGDQQILRVSTDTGTGPAGLAVPSTVGPRSIYFAGGNVYVCGIYSSPSSSFIFNHTVTPQGSQAGIVIELSGDLSANALGLRTFGSSFGGNFADSVVVDEAGSVYVSGHSGFGVFSTDASVASSGQWAVQLVKGGTGGGPTSVASASDAATLLGYATPQNSPINYYSTINFGSGSQGVVGNDLAFPNGASTEFVTYAVGSIWVPTFGTYTFFLNTDDGNWLNINGLRYFTTPGLQAPTDDTTTVALNRGVYVIEAVQFQHQGGASFELTYTNSNSNVGRQLLPATQLTDSQNKGYVLKFNSDLSSLTGSYFTTINSAGSGGRITELRYSQGWIYAVGFWKGLANNPAIGLNDNSSNGSEDIEVLKLDTNLQLKGRATVKGISDNEGYSVTPDDAGNVYITGSFGPGSVDFVGNGDRNSTDASQDGKFTSLSSPIQSLFVAKLDSNLNYQWAKGPTTAAVASFSSTAKLRWNSTLQRLFWAGTFFNGSITLGQPDAPATLSGAVEGFVAVLEPDGTFTEQVYLTIVSAFGQSGTQIQPFGGPLVGGNPTSTNRQPVLKGVPITASVPSIIFRKGQVDVTTDDQADTRISSTGYSVDNNVANGTANNYTFTITADTTVTFNWEVDYALNITADLSGTVGTGDPAHGIAGIPGLTSLASGNPVPAVQKHWTPANDTVIAAIDASVLDLNSPGLPVKYLVTGYDASGPANSQNSNATNFFAFSGNDTRRQVPQFIMTGPASINYHWKLKIGVQVDTTGPSSVGFPLIMVVKDPGQTNSAPPTQPNGVGTGTFYYDEHTSLQIGTLKHQGTIQLQGWLNGDGTIFASSGDLTNLNSSFTVNGSNGPLTYVSQSVPNLVQPARVMWNYGDRIFEETVFIGNSVTFSTVDDPAVKAMLRTDLPPPRVDVTDGPQGSVANDMAIWDPQGKKYYPLRPGTVLSYWQTTSSDPTAVVIIRLVFKYPSSPHYRHIASTPPVPLPTNTNNPISFNALKYTEPTTGAAVDNSGNFTATGSGNTVLLFNETSSVGRGGRITTLRVRVVQSSLWNANLPTTQTAIIGQKITSSYDTAGLGTGYVFFQNARYNASIYNRTTVQGPIIPVNLFPTAGPTQQLVVVWYETRDTINWPYQSVLYNPAWPTPDTGLGRIVIASRFGNESVATNGTDQIVTPAEMIGTNLIAAETTFDPVRFQQVQIYNQPDPTKPGYNPNEEHALLAPSLRSVSVSPRPQAAYALRDGDLNITNRDATYTSDPYVLVQFFDALHQEFKMKVYSIVRSDANLNLGDLSYQYTFTQQMNAGEPVIPFYPLGPVIGATPCAATYGRDGQPGKQICFWKDHKGTYWAVSGDSFFFTSFYYPLSPDFWWPTNQSIKMPGDCVAWLPSTPRYAGNFFVNASGAPIDYTRNDQVPAAQAVQYTTVWPQNLPILKVGETLTFPGGEYASDNPNTTVTLPDGSISIQPTPGLPGVVGWAAGQIVFDTKNPLMNDESIFSNYTARLFPALEQRTVDLPVGQFPDILQPANKRTTVQNGNFVFTELPSSLQKRIFYDPVNGKLGIVGFLNNKSISDTTLTASPGAVYVLEPNVLTLTEQTILDGGQGSPFADLAGTPFTQAMDALVNLSRNPNSVRANDVGAWRVGLDQEVQRDINGTPITTTNFGIVSVQHNPNKGSELQALGPGLALVANPAFLDPFDTNLISYVTVAENNSDLVGSAPVVLHIIKIDKSQRYRGAIQTILSANVFDENIVLRHTGDFGGNAEDLVFEWWYRPEDGTTARTPDRQPSPTPWKLFADPSGNQGRGFYQLTLKGNPSAPDVLLGDTLFFVRYRHKNEVVSSVNWEVPQPNGEQHCELNNCVPGIPYQWAGAGNSTPQDLNGDGIPDYVAQLAEGWIKRVLDRINPYEARINDFTADAPASYSSILQELGARYSGPVALNPDKNVIENVGLIALYQTILARGESLSINLSTPVSTPSISDALELASTRLNDFYVLLGNEAYSDSQNPTIGYGSDSVQYGSLAPSVFAFENQVSSLLEEELALLRGQDQNLATPVYNRLFWNFTSGEGEAAYVMKYDITDVNQDGFTDQNDAMILYPQGHGDAWGHYLTALTLDYDLLRNPNFNWVSRSEFVNINDIVVPVDYLDERKFAAAAAAKAQAGAEIVNLTYREKYVADPSGQWQGYTDTDTNRAWGVEEWARRAGQGAYFDWVTANALLPAVHPNTTLTGIQKVDRTTVQDISVVAANLWAVQTTMEQVNNGNNPLGVASGALTFAIDPALLNVPSGTQGAGAPVAGQTLFDQVYQRALTALSNAKTTFDNANQLNNMIRQVANADQNFQNQVEQQDISYRNQLIEIFGTPYSGTIGSGQAFPAGYLGPDTMLYMYVDVNNLNDNTVPQPPATYYSNYQALISSTFFTAPVFLGIFTNANPTLSSNGTDIAIAVNYTNQYNLTFSNPLSITNTVNYTDFTDPNNNPLNNGVNELTNLNLPIMASGYTFVAPPTFGSRATPGELQILITQMLQSQASLNQALYSWDNTQSTFLQKLELMNAKYDLDTRLNQDIKNKLIADSVLSGVSLALRTAAGVAKIVINAADVPVAAAKTAVPTSTPTVGLADSLGDALAPIRAALDAIKGSLDDASEGVQLGLNTAADVVDLSKEIGDQVIELQQDTAEKNFELIQDLLELQNDASNEANDRVAVFKQIQALSQLSDQYKAKLQDGLRLMQQRTAYNKRVAAQATQNRFQDMTFRISRNAALEKYRSAFDLAARYTYLAATAYDYDTNLRVGDPGAPTDLFADIVRQRTLGLVNSNGIPAVGAGGLAEDLAQLKANYDALRTSLGINNPQIETTTFSLRTETFRILGTTNSDANWAQTLRGAQIYQPDLWQVAEFRNYCRPFSSPTNGAQPGLVIPFSTQIRPNQNFFGWPLGGGDNSYDPSVYATRIASVAVWFAGYDVVNLPQTPRVYLIPVGQDIMTIPTSPDLELRTWNVVDQTIPIPYPSSSANLQDPNWKPLTDSLQGSFGNLRQFSSFRAFGFDHSVLSPYEQTTLVFNARLVGRSVWNTRWLMIIPGATLNADPNQGLNQFINSVKDIKLVVNSYGYSGN